MVISKPETVAAPPNGAATGTSAAAAAADLDAGSNSLAHPSGIPQDQIDNIMSGISNTGDVRMNNHRKKLRQRFDIIKKLGQGTYGKVQLGINKETGQEVAIKTIKKCKIEAEADLVRIRREVQIMSSVQHPNIIHIYEVFENREKMVLVMEFAAGGELYDYLSERKVLNEEEARRIFRQVATAVYYCHKHKICHRDLKLENILLDEKGNAKIADFGLSNVFDAGRLLGTFCGSPLYASPEIVEGTPYQGPEVDCWSLGVLLYTLVYGSMPFDGSNFKRLVKQISQGDYYEPRKPSRASTLIRDMLTVCPRKRATIEQICSHWWVNENDNVSCLDLAEDLANQTPVRLDVLLSLTPATITADQMVVPSAEGAAAAAKAAANERVPRSHSVGSIRDMGPPNTEAERRILDMVAAGGEAALMPSPTRTITPAQSPVQTKRKLQPTVSTENAAGTTAKKKEKPANSSFVISGAAAAAPPPPTEPMRPAPAPPTLMEAETIGHIPEEKPRMEPCFSQKDMQMVGDLCEQLMEGEASGTPTPTPTPIPTPAPVTAAPPVAVSRQPTRGKLDAVAETPEEKDATKVIKKFVNKHKTADLVNAINESATASGKVVPAPATGAVGAATSVPPFVRKCSLQDESTLNKFNAERRKSRILETAEKFQPPPPVTTGPGSQAATEKPKKLSIPGVSVGSFKKEFERKATNPPATAGPTPGELRAQEQVAAAAAAAQEAESQSLATPPASPVVAQSLEASDSKNSVTSISLDEARRSMENSIALLLQAQNESNKEVDQLCAQTETIGVSEPTPTREERERKLKNARAIIGNAIQPVIRRPAPFCGIGNGNGNGFGGGSGIGNRGPNSAPIRAESGNNFTGYLTPSPPICGPQTAPPVLISPNALAAAKQTIQQRLFGSGLPSKSNQPTSKRPATWQPQAAYSSASIFQPASSSSPFKMLQQKYQQEQQRGAAGASSAMFTPPPSPQYAPPANSSSSNVNRSGHSSNSSNSSNNNCNTMPYVNYNVNSRTRPFHNQAQDTLNTNASSTSAMPAAMWLKSSPGADGQPGTPGAVKTSTASITLKSATLPRRKINAKSEVQLEIKPRIPEQAPQPAMRFSTEMQHPVADLRSAPPREGPIPYSPIKTTLPGRATSLEPKEHVITIQRPPTQHAYGRTSSNTTTRSGSLSRQSTVESESDATTTTATNMSQATVTGQGTSQPIKKSPREFIIPIAVEGGGFITPRERSIEPSESSHTTASSRSTFSRLRPSRHIGSLLSEAVFDEGSPFQKMRTTSITRDGGPGAGADEEARFTPHRLRSSRPVKKISQDNDSQSSNEEDDDDDDGFEILTAENLFSTLLQRVRNLTNRLNVNSDLTVGFPSHSSRLLTDISRQAQSHSPFWSQGVSPFARSQVSYTSSYSETVEKKQVRLNSGSNSGGLGAPWRHSMSRDLGSDMESMFSRTGATLPRGHHQGKGSSSRPSSTPANVEKVAPTSATAAAAAAAGGTSEEPLDLADLDLSRLRLSKKDLETLSSITPGLPKCFQEQLLAKLPPTQARKLSRTLSVQTSAPSSGVTQKPYKRSQSGGRGYLPDQPEEDFKAKPLTDAPKTTAASTAIYRRSLSRSQALAQTQTQSNQEGAQPATVSTTTSKSRSSSVCRDDYGKSSLCSSSYTSDISDKYKYYSPYLSKSSNGTTTTTTTTKEVPEKRYSAGLGRPPSGCMSPPPNGALPTSVPVAEGSSSLRGRSSQRRISRFLRPDFFDDPRDRETQNVLREIREKSSDRMEQADQRRRKHSLPNVEQADQQPTLEPGPVRSSMRHTRNKSVELFPDGEATPQQTGQTAPEASGKRSGLRQRSVSRPRELETDLDKHELADKILQELQLLSAVRTQHEQGKIPDVETDKTEETSTIRKVKKVKPKEAASNDAEASKLSTTTTTTTTTLVRKVKKVSRKTDEPKTPSTETAATEIPVPASTPKETRLKRPKSYPMKDLGLSLKSPTELPEPSSSASAMPSKLPSKLPSAAGNESQTGESAPRESRLMRPKSYPATKLATPKELRKVTRSGAAIPTISEASPAVTAAPSATGTPVSSKSTSEEKSLSATPTGTMSNVTDTKDTASSSSDSRPTTIKKIIKVSKKSKLVPPTPVTPTTTPSATTTTNTTATTTPADSSKESSPVIKTKEKSPEKKSSKGLLYALGQKFEKLRDSAMSKDRKTATSGGATTLACTQKQGSPEERSSPEKATVLRKKKSLEPEKSIELPAEDKRVDKRSRFDSMLRSLRERSVPRSQSSSRASPKRAASVEELHAGDTDAGTGKQSGAVNKMFGGLLRRFDRESSEQRRVRSTRSTSNIERQVREEQDALLPTSPIYQNVVKAKPTVLPPGASEENCNCETACPDCRQNQGQANSLKPNSTSSSSGATPSIKEKRKGLMLDLASAQGASGGAASAVTTATTTTSGSSYRGSKTNPALINGNGGMGLYSNLPPYPGAVKSASSNNSSSQQSVENATNNNSTNTNNNCSSQTSGYRTSSAHEINRNNPLLTPSFENIANYSSDSRSYQDDCASTSTFLSPTEEPELYFDNWSICSEDNFMLHATPSPTVSRLSRASLSSPTRCSESSDPNESVIDRIKRRSFYSRFNEQKKPRRTSSIVGPSAVRDYYREQQAAVKARSSHKLHVAEVEPRAHSPDIAQQFFRPLKLSPVGTELKPPMYRSPLDYSTSSSGGATSKPRKSLNDIRNTSPSFLSKRYEVHDYSSVPMRYKSSSSSSPSNGAIASGYYNTYNPKRRSSYTLNGSLPTASSSSAAGSSHLDGYATLGRRSIRPYDHRTMSLLEPPTTSSSSAAGSSAYQRREARTPVRDYTSSISRSGSRYRTSSATRSPTNI
ncbi:serine-rich adhesin for platelets isoform X2 [Drosophila subobscura]|uniref:serine-rich adhesin for platelets isoform X2 n=1 Tax=Drosophila subobscura TaxID=7241 RepID=UPI00155A974B|nr:serine-rich adhesin for platelets isoform X2 [Drosophila subobscura]